MTNQSTTQAHPNCIRWPHMPPHCGCPAVAPATPVLPLALSPLAVAPGVSK